jgi:hypothetical protein
MMHVRADPNADPDLSYYELVRPLTMYDGGAAKCAYGCTDPVATNYEAGAEEDDGSCVDYCTSAWADINQATEYRCLKRTTGFERYVHDDQDCPSYCTPGIVVVICVAHEMLCWRLRNNTRKLWVV